MPSCCPRVVMATFTMSFHLLLATLLIGGGMSAASDDQRETKPCPSNGEWISVNRTECVRVHEGDPLTWEEAQEVCRKDGGGHLLFNIDLIFQDPHLKQLITGRSAFSREKPSRKGALWLGIRGRPGNLTLSSGVNSVKSPGTSSDAEFLHFLGKFLGRGKEPARFREQIEVCMSLERSGRIFRASCMNSRRRNFICQRSLMSSDPLATKRGLAATGYDMMAPKTGMADDDRLRAPASVLKDVELDCPPDWTQAANMCFRVFDSTYLTTWQAAREFCQQLGNNGDLAVFEEWTTFFDVIGSGTESSWIGQYWDVEAGGWMWVDGTAPTWAEWDGVLVPADPVVNERLGCVAVKNEFSYAVHYQANCNAYKPPVCRMDADTAGQSSITYPTVAPIPKCGGSFSEWYAFGSKCVMPFREDKKSWHDARLHCHELGGDLVSIHSSEEMAFVESIYAIGGELPSLEPDVYIGLRRDEKNPDSDNFLWSDGSPFDYENWTPGEPSNFENQESCVQFYAKGGTWNDFNCAAAFAYVCQVSACEPECSSVTPVPTTPPPTLSCEDGWEPMGPWCLKVVAVETENPDADGLPWVHAKQECRAQNAWVASIHSRDENEKVRQMSETASTSGRSGTAAAKVWIGLTDFIPQSFDEFFWEDQSRLDYLNWGPNEPDDFGTGCVYGRAECVAMDVASGLWTTEICENAGSQYAVYGFVCRKLSS